MVRASGTSGSWHVEWAVKLDDVIGSPIVHGDKLLLNIKQVCIHFSFLSLLLLFKNKSNDVVQNIFLFAVSVCDLWQQSLHLSSIRIVYQHFIQLPLIF